MRFTVRSLLILTTVEAVVCVVLPRYVSLTTETQWALVLGVQGAIELAFIGYAWRRKSRWKLVDEDSE